MAYVERFFAEFLEAPTKGPLNPTPALFRLSFRQKDYTGIATELNLYRDRGVKLSVAEQGGATGIFQAINARRGTFKLQATTAWDAKALYVESDRQVQAILLRDETGTGSNFQTYLASWVLPAAFKQEYRKKPYPVEVSSACGLSTLKDRPLVDSAGKRLSGLVNLSTILRTAFALTGLDLPMVVIDNLYGMGDVAVGQTVGGFVDVERCPLFQTRINADTFVNSDGDAQTAYEVIERILKPKGLCAMQLQGAWWIVRREETPGGWNPTWTPSSSRARNYNNPDITDGPSPGLPESLELNHTVYPDQSIRAAAGGSVGLLPTASSIRIEQTFGELINKLPNGNFTQFDVNGFPTGWFKNNVPASGPERPHVVGLGTEADPYGLYIFGGGDEKFNEDSPWVGITLDYPPGSVERFKPIKRTLRGRFKTQNVRAAKIVVLAFVKGQFYFLQPGGEWKQNPSTKENKINLLYHTLTDAGGKLIAKPGYAEINLSMNALKGVEKLGIYLCCAEALDEPNNTIPYVIYENMRLETAVDGIVVNGQQVTIQTRKAKIDTTLSLSVGDVPDPGLPYDRTSTFMSRQTGPVTAGPFWYRPDANVLAPNPIGKDKGRGLIYYLADAYARQLLTPTQTFEDKLFGRLPYGLFTVLRVADVGKQLGNTFAPDPFALTRWDEYPRECEHELTAVEIKLDPVPVEAKTIGEWQTPDGPIPMDLDQDGVTPIDPTIAQHTPFRDQVLSIIGNNKPPIKLKITPNIPGFVPLAPGQIKLKLTVYNGALPIGFAQAVARKLLKFKFPA